MKTILITGGAGMIGQEIIRQLLKKKNWLIVVFDNFSNEYRRNEPLIEHENVVYEKNSSLLQVIGAYNPSVISHQASLVSVGESMANPERYLKNNIGITAELIQAMLDLKWKGLVIHASSMSVYEDLPLSVRNEDQNMWPTSFYGISKLTQEMMLELYSKISGNTVVLLRYFSVYDTKFNVNNTATGIFNIFANQYLSEGKIEFYGDGTATRDMIHVSDVAYMHNKAIQKKWAYPRHEINVGTGIATTMNEIVARLMDCMVENRARVPVFFNGKKRMGDIYHSKADIGRAKDEKIAPKTFVKLEDSIRKYGEFIKNGKFTITNKVSDANKELEKRGLVK